MSSVIQPAITLGAVECAGRFAQTASRRFARRACQAMVLLPLFSLILLPEYMQGLGDPETKSILYRATIGPLRMVDVLLLGIITAHTILWLSSRKMRVGFPRTLAIPGFGFLFAIAIAMAYGGLHGGTNLFFDWRALALGIGTYGVFAMWVQTPAEGRSAMLLFAGFMALRIGLIYASFFTGGGDVIVGMRIPLFDGPTLSAIVFTAVLASCMSDYARGAWHKLSWMSLSALAYLLVLLCFRRTFWAELGTATVLLLLLHKRRRGRKLVVAIATVAAVAVILGPTFYERVQSMDFTTGESELSQDNPDHVGEVLDAWEEVRREPLLGIGLGRSYPTLRIQDWKEESVMVHNAALHVWLKYGLMGLISYVWFQLAVFRWLYQRYQGLREQAELQIPRRGWEKFSPYSFGMTSQERIGSTIEQPTDEPIQLKTSTSGAKVPHIFSGHHGTAEGVPFHLSGLEVAHRSTSRRTDSTGAIVQNLAVQQLCQPSVQRRPPVNPMWPVAALAYLAAQFAVSLGFTPWPYSSLQSTILIAFILSVATTGTTQCKFPYSLSSHLP